MEERQKDTVNADVMAASRIRLLKRSMRKELAGALMSMNAGEIGRQSSAITRHVLRHPAFERATNISVYVSMAQGEVQTEEICRQALQRGKSLYVPRFAASGSDQSSSSAVPGSSAFSSDMRMLRIQNWSDYEAMTMNRWGIREPEDLYGEGRRQDALDVEAGARGLDLILVPGVAFDRHGGRLGHGKGYYDRYITRASQLASRLNRPQPQTVALALLEQVLEAPLKVPRDEYDLGMDEILTADGALPLSDPPAS